MRCRHLALKHQHGAVVPRRPRLDGEPRDQKRGGDVVRQIGDDAHRRALEARARIEGRARPPRRCRGGRDNARRSPGAPRSRDRRARPRSTRAAPSANSARVRPPGPGPTSYTVASASGSAARAMRSVRLRSNRKFCPSDFFAARPWRRMTSRSGGRPSLAPVTTRRAKRGFRPWPAAPQAAARRRGSSGRRGRCRRCRRRCRGRARCARKAGRA